MKKMAVKYILGMKVGWLIQLNKSDLINPINE